MAGQVHSRCSWPRFNRFPGSRRPVLGSALSLLASPDTPIPGQQGTLAEGGGAGEGVVREDPSPEGTQLGGLGAFLEGQGMRACWALLCGCRHIGLLSSPPEGAEPPQQPSQPSSEEPPPGAPTECASMHRPPPQQQLARMQDGNSSGNTAVQCLPAARGLHLPAARALARQGWPRPRQAEAHGDLVVGLTRLALFLAAAAAAMQPTQDAPAGADTTDPTGFQAYLL